MKKTMGLFLAIFLLLYFFNSSKAHAIGIGVYGSYGGGTADWNPSADAVDKFRKNASHLSYGLALDTAPANERIFNYNLSIGHDRFKNRNGNAWGNADLDGVVITNNFGFGGLITKNIRLWAGPEVRVSWSEGSADRFPDFNLRVFGIGVGPSIGVNFNVGERLTFVVKGGYQYMSYFGYGQGMYDHLTNTASSSHRYYYSAHEDLYYVAIEILLRTLSGK